VPGLAAKPIIDMMASVRHLADGHAAQPALAPLGYELLDTGMPDRLFFQRRGGPGISTHHLHVVREDTWPEQQARPRLGTGLRPAVARALPMPSARGCRPIHGLIQEYVLLACSA
jgi:GrpB-like predicted nucleotidyltransferase (UPF0157 family)